jgi:LacI family transcriptional regulator
MRVTIKDVAKKAGVSHATVSRALNGHKLIPARTAAEIRRIAEEMGYLPSAAARGLKTNRSHALGVIVSRIDDPYFGEILQGVEEVLQNTGYSLFVSSTHSNSAREGTIVRALGERQVDGVIISSVAFSAENAHQLQKFGMPTVVINNQSGEDYRFSIAHDDLDGSRKVTHHLLSLGHRQIAYISNDQAGRNNQDRLLGFQTEIAAAGLPEQAGIVIHQTGGEIENGAAGIRQLLNLHQVPTAIFCFNDLMGFGALHELRQAGLAVPGDFSVAGFDNIPFSAYTNPGLTTFDQPKHHIGAEAARLMLALLSNQDDSPLNGEPVNRLLQGQLLARESTAPVNFSNTFIAGAARSER